MPTPPCIDEEYTLPTVEALLAGTLALLTGYAQSTPDGAHRAAMARKAAAHLGSLAAHPQLSAPMRAMLANLRQRWQQEAQKAAPDTPPPALWHAAPEALQ